MKYRNAVKRHMGKALAAAGLLFVGIQTASADLVTDVTTAITATGADAETVGSAIIVGITLVVFSYHVIKRLLGR